MTEVTQDNHRWIGMTVIDVDGAKVGKVADVYLGQYSRRPDWALVHSGLLVTHRMFVPLVGARVEDDHAMQVTFTKNVIDTAPAVAADGHLTAGEEDALYRHYGLEATLPPTRGGIPDHHSRSPTQPAPASTTPDGTMIRSEEELQVGAISRPAEVVRLRKYVVTEDRQITVPVRREEIRIERIPVTDDMIAGWPDPGVQTQLGGDDSAELVLLEEQIVVTKRIVPRERVRLAKDVITENRDVTDQVRQERIDLEHHPITAE